MSTGEDLQLDSNRGLGNDRDGFSFHHFQVILRDALLGFQGKDHFLAFASPLEDGRVVAVDIIHGRFGSKSD